MMLHKVSLSVCIVYQTLSSVQQMKNKAKLANSEINDNVSESHFVTNTIVTWSKIGELSLFVNFCLFST